MGKKNKRKPRIRKDNKGEYILRSYFVRGKQKFYREYVIDGIPVEEYWEKYADPIALMQNGDYDLLAARLHEEAERTRDEPSLDQTVPENIF
jgi:hypothetical protein